MNDGSPFTIPNNPFSAFEFWMSSGNRIANNASVIIRMLRQSTPVDPGEMQRSAAAQGCGGPLRDQLVPRRDADNGSWKYIIPPRRR
jgi:hypothetical protein